MEARYAENETFLQFFSILPEKSALCKVLNRKKYTVQGNSAGFAEFFSFSVFRAGASIEENQKALLLGEGDFCVHVRTFSLPFWSTAMQVRLLLI